MTTHGNASADAAVVRVIDDDLSLRRALAGLLRSTGMHARTYATTDEFLAEDDRASPGCLVLDIRMPGISGLDFQYQLAALDIQLPVVMVTGHGDVPTSVRAMKAGAVDFLSKPFRDHDMLDALDGAIEHDRCRRAQSLELARVHALYKKLTPRERQVMRYVTTGMMNKQIAHELNLSEVTVKIHRRSVVLKTEVNNLAELVRMSDLLQLHRAETLLPESERPVVVNFRARQGSREPVRMAG